MFSRLFQGAHWHSLGGGKLKDREGKTRVELHAEKLDANFRVGARQPDYQLEGERQVFRQQSEIAIEDIDNGEGGSSIPHHSCRKPLAGIDPSILEQASRWLQKAQEVCVVVGLHANVCDGSFWARADIPGQEVDDVCWCERESDEPC